MNASTTKLSLDYLRGMGYEVDVVERWVGAPGGGNRIRKDLFGILDLVAIRGNETLGVQTTSKGQISVRARKIAESPNLPLLKAAGWRIVVHGWHQPNGPRTRYALEELVIYEGGVPAQRPRRRLVRVG